ncbi:MAG: LCP family protein [Eubacteriales bacterium]|nr:LCP family protein [Eubacteriales bacterium]
MSSDEKKKIRHVSQETPLPLSDEEAYAQAYRATYGTEPPAEGEETPYVPFDESASAPQEADEYAPEPVQVQQPANRPHHRKRRKKQSTAKKVIIWVLLALLAVVLVIGVKYLIDINNPQNLFAQSTPSAVITPEPTPDDSAGAVEVTPTPEPTVSPEELLMAQADMEFMKNRVNVLVLGVDESTERENWGSFRTDTMIMVTIDFDTNQVNMISIPRDSYVKIYNKKDAEGNLQFDKVNSAFSTGGGAQKKGYEYAMKTISYLFGGMPVDYYVAFNMNVVKEIVDAMGGVDYDVDVEVHMNGRTLLIGPQHLDGQGVLDYCRLRHGSSDLARVDRQQRIIMAIFQQLKSTGQIKNIPTIYQALQENIQTNLDFTQISSLALLALRMDLQQLQRDTVPGEFMTIRTRSYWGVNTKQLQSMINRIFGGSVSIDSTMDAGNILELVEANRALIATELALANNALNTANQILQDYKDWLTDDVYQTLKQSKNQLQDAVEEESKELLDYYTPPVQQLCDTILAQLQQYGQGGTAETAPVPEEIPQIPTV